MTISQSETSAATDNPESANHLSYPGVQAPERQWRCSVAPGLELAVHEWGSQSSPILLLAHGGSDFARTFDRFAPLLAQGGWRVVSWDHRGHGDSGRAALYSWDSDLADLRLLLTRLGSERIALVGHSKGGGLLSSIAAAYPERFTHLVNIDGVPSSGRRFERPPVEERIQRRDRMFASWFDHRRRAHSKERRPGTLEELAERRARMNPRLEIEWLRYLVTVGATQRMDGWRWNLDPVMRMGGVGPWRPDWGLHGLRDIEVPMKAILGRQQEPMGWGTDPDAVAPFLPPDCELEVYEDCGHFVHIEQPERTAESVLGFLGSPAKTPLTSESTLVFTPPPPKQRRPQQAASPSLGTPHRRLQHARIELGLWRLPVEGAPSGSRNTLPLLLLPGLGETVHDFWASGELHCELEAWPGAVYALDWSGHGASSRGVGGGYATDDLMGDVDAALAELGPCILLGRGLGAYVALQMQGARPQQVRSAILCAGPGLEAGGPEPPEIGRVGSAHSLAAGFERASKEAPSRDVDPLALAELAIEVRPPGYARLFLRQANALSGLENPIFVHADLAAASPLPEWLDGLVEERGVRVLDLIEAMTQARQQHELAAD